MIFSTLVFASLLSIIFPSLMEHSRYGREDDETASRLVATQGREKCEHVRHTLYEHFVTVRCSLTSCALNKEAIVYVPGKYSI